MSGRRHMRSRLAAILGVALAGAIVTPPNPARAEAVHVSIGRFKVTTRLGDGFRFTTRVTNSGARALTAPVLNLNVVSLDPGVYVDPEDWSSRRTRYLARLGPGDSVTTSWRVTAVTSGRVQLVVTLLPRPGARRGAPPEVAPALDVYVAKRETLNSGGVLPLAVGVPALLGLAAVGLRIRRRTPRR